MTHGEFTSGRDTFSPTHRGVIIERGIRNVNKRGQKSGTRKIRLVGLATISQYMRDREVSNFHQVQVNDRREGGGGSRVDICSPSPVVSLQALRDKDKVVFRMA